MVRKAEVEWGWVGPGNPDVIVHSGQCKSIVEIKDHNDPINCGLRLVL